MKIALATVAAIVLGSVAPASAAGPTVSSFENFLSGHLPGPFPSLCGVEANFRSIHEVGTQRVLADGSGGLHLRRDVTTTMTFSNDLGGPGTVFIAWTTTSSYVEVATIKPGAVTTTTTVSKATTAIGPTGRVLATRVVTHTTIGADGQVRSEVDNELGSGTC